MSPVSWAEAPAGSGGEKSADAVARELPNPNNALASLTFKNQFRWYKGDLPNAGDQSNYTLLFQPVFPFSLEPTASGAKANLFVRPAFPLLVDQPVPGLNGGKVEFNGVSAIGDIGFDIGYGVTEPNGLLWAVGMVGTLPTATDSDVAGKQLRLGPELLVAKFEKWGLYGIFPSHQWDVAGWSDDAYSTSQLQLFLKFLPGGGWNVGSSPIMNYDRCRPWRAKRWPVVPGSDQGALFTRSREAAEGKQSSHPKIALSHCGRCFAPRTNWAWSKAPDAGRPGHK